MKRTALTLTALALLPTIAAAAEPAPLDEEFVEYLSEFEGQSDNWTWFAEEDEVLDEEQQQPAAPAKPVKEVVR